MTRRNQWRTRLGMTWLALALGALALLAIPGLAAARDRNHDRIPDRWETKHHLSLGVNQARRNQDGDRLRNRAEFLAGDDPRDADSNDDGVEDGADNAGTIVSFDQKTGQLAIDLFGGGTLSGLVNDETEIKCEHEHSSASASSEPEPGDDHGGDNSGSEGGGEAGNCTTADLVPGAVVQEAELNASNGQATFEEVELSGRDA